jgi:ribosomal protein L37E
VGYIWGYVIVIANFKMKKKTDIKEQIWTALFLVTPIIILSRLSELFADSSLNRILFAGLFGGLGGLIGAGLLQLVKTRTTVIKTVSVILLTGFCITTIIVANKLRKPTLETCEICGYKAVGTTKKECEYCGSLSWDEQKKIIGYNDRQEWLRDEQLFWFSLDSLTQKVDFYNPIIDEGFEKDKDWKPIITVKELIDDFDNKE